MYEFKLPDLGEGVAEGEIARWLVEVGQQVEEDDPLVEIQTDKTTVEIPSPASGTVARILVQAGELVPVGTPLVVIGDGEVEAAPDERGDQVRAEEPAPVADAAEAAQPAERVTRCRPSRSSRSATSPRSRSRAASARTCPT